MNQVKISRNYVLFEDGRLYNIETKKYRKWYKSHTGYLCSTIWQNKKPVSILQHRLLAEYYIPNHDNKSQVNHINGIKDDNRLCNLEWVTPSENRKHAYDTGLQKKRYKKVIDIIEGTIYESVISAAEHHNITKVYLSMMLRGVRENKTNLQFYNN